MLFTFFCVISAIRLLKRSQGAGGEMEKNKFKYYKFFFLAFDYNFFCFFNNKLMKSTFIWEDIQTMNIKSHKMPMRNVQTVRAIARFLRTYPSTTAPPPVKVKDEIRKISKRMVDISAKAIAKGKGLPWKFLCICIFVLEI